MSNKKKLVLLSSLIAIVIIILMVYFTNSSYDKDPSRSKDIDKNLLVGNWVRTDASYLIKIDSVINDGTLKAEYFNPQPINVESANWEENNGDLKISIVLRDTNYPGSKYTLNYLPKSDLLAGEYYQAVEHSTFYVEFARGK